MDTFYIPDYLKNNIHKVALEEIQTNLKIITKTLKEQIDKYKQDKRNLLKRKAELLADIKRLRQEINDQLDKLERSSVAEIEHKFKIIEGKAEEGLKLLQENKDRVTSVLNEITSSTTNQTEEFVYAKMGEEAAKVGKTSIEDYKMKIKVEGIQFYPNRTLITQLEKINSLGMIPSLLQIKGKRSFGVKIRSDKDTCFISSACYMEDGTIILVDNNNNKVKQLRYNNHNSYTIRDYCKLPGAPWQVCVIDKGLVAVSHRLNGVYFIGLERQMKITKNINTDFPCYGLAYANNNLFISDRDTSVYIYTLSGKKLRQFRKDQSGLRLFSDIYSLAVSKDASRIYVADNDNGLIVLDDNGQVVSTYNGKQSQGACYCHFTGEDTVLVSGLTYKTVVQFTFNGEPITQVLTAVGKIYSVMTVCCNQQLSEMCISRGGEDNIEVYDINMCNE